jgi:hypothetical protein
LEVAWALPCRFAEAAADGTATIVGAGLDSMWVTEVPADVGTFLVMRVTGPQYEFEAEHTVVVKLVDPERNEHDILISSFGPMEESPPTYHPGLDPGILLPAAVSWRAEHLGLYTLEIYVDEKRNRSVPILVRDAAEFQQEDV